MSQESSVYVIAKMDGGKPVSPIKVGISSNMTARLSTIQTSCPFPIDVIYEFGTPSVEIARHIERSFHETQTAYRQHGEWFNLDPIVAVQLVCIAYRVAVEITAPSELQERILDFAGVFWAEKRFGFKSAGSTIQ